MSKRKREVKGEEEEENGTEDLKNALIQLISTEGVLAGGKEEMDISLDTTTEQLKDVVNELLKNEESRPYIFFLNDQEIKRSLRDSVIQQKLSTERVLSIRYEPQAIWRVRAVTRCSSTIQGHAEAVLHVHFSADGKKLASGSGDGTVRLWDVLTQTPHHTLKGHKSWVLAVAWSPDTKWIASGDRDGTVIVWDPETGKKKKSIKAHTKPVVAISWEPFLSNPKCDKFASASLDGSVKIWDSKFAKCVRTMSGHTAALHDIRWGGSGLIYTASHDRTIRVWTSKEGKLVRTLTGHAHRVNSIALNTDYALRTGPYDQKGNCPQDAAKALEAAKEKYHNALAGKGELLVSGSDDFTLILWNPTVDKKPILRLTGHQQPVNFVLYSPDGRFVASACFDKSVRIWDGRTGKFLSVLRAHVQAVYQVCWSSDSRLLVTSSKDSTIKVWDVEKGKMLHDLPGHADEVYAVDWSPDGSLVASGGKDRVLKIWRR